VGAASSDYSGFSGNEKTFQENEKKMLEGAEHRINFISVTPHAGLLAYGEQATNVYHSGIMFDFADEVVARERTHNLVHKTIKDYIDRHNERRTNISSFRLASIPRISEYEEKIDSRAKFRQDVTHALENDYRDKVRKYGDFVDSDDTKKKLPIGKKEAPSE